ncbi:MAG: type II toxin-antitoxin system HicA family toxin [Blautia sp.]|nr:type II toxin-antitoxin system HicA family toxin [Blautia sp.]
MDNNISEGDMYFFLDKIGGFYKRTSGSHRMYGFDGIPEQVNMQPKDGKIKSFEVRQIRELARKYKLDRKED